MGLEPSKRLASQFKNLLDHGQLKENVFQAFLEDKPEFLITPYLLNHHLHWSILISQLRLTTSLTADFAYLTKSSIQWRLVLVEIERPDINLFLSNSRQVTPSAEFTKRIAQVHDWKDQLRRNPLAVLRSLEPLRRPLEGNDVDIKYLLVIGRSENHFQNEACADRLRTLGGDDLQISTFDSLLRHYISGHAEKKNTLVIRKNVFHFKKLAIPPTSLFAYLRPHELHLTVSEESRLRSWGFDIPSWKAGKQLVFNGRKPIDGFGRFRRTRLEV